MNKEKRLCTTCLSEMDSGYIYDSETYCCDECLPISVEQFEEEYDDEGDNCWTQWESIYLD